MLSYNNLCKFVLIHINDFSAATFHQPSKPQFAYEQTCDQIDYSSYK